MNILINGHHREETKGDNVYSFEYSCYVGKTEFPRDVAICYYNEGLRMWRYSSNFSQRALSLPYNILLLEAINEYASENIIL